MRRFVTTSMALLLFGASTVANSGQTASQTTLKPEELKTSLSNMGYEVKESKSTDGAPMYDVAWTSDDGWKYSMTASISPSGRIAWLVMNLGSTDDVAKVPKEAFLGLMTENDAIMPMSYSWHPKLMRFYLNNPVDARDFSPQSLRKGMDAMVASVKRTADFWDPAKWKK